MSKPVLGRGLGALLGGGRSSPATPAAPSPVPAAVAGNPFAFDTPPPAGTTVHRVALDRVFPSPLQPRKDFPPESLRELADSIREQGIVQPLIVRPVDGRFELIAGERRWRAARLAGLTEVPVVERHATDRELLELALIENLQRENLNPIEEALGYSQLGAQFELTQELIAQKVGRSRVVVANALRLLKLVPEVQVHLRAGTLSVGHGKVLLGITDPKQQLRTAERVVREGLTVRQLEKLLAEGNAPQKPAPAPAPAPPRNPHVTEVENKLRERFATRIGLRYSAGVGSIELSFASDDELNRLLDLLGVSVD